jgi:phosphatidylinositol 3,5-bisphosphate 5-phosphatase
MSVITKRSPVALLGGHYVYHIDETRLISIASDEVRKLDKKPEEARYLSTLDHLDISKTFYFSYSYDITGTLQSNILRQRQLFERGEWYGSINIDGLGYNDMFVWNHFLLKAAGEKQSREIADWCVPIIHGFVDQASSIPSLPLVFGLSTDVRNLVFWTVGLRLCYRKTVAVFCWCTLFKAWCQ